MITNANYKILVVDDDPSVLGFISLILKRKGYVIDAFEKAEDALGILQQKNFDAVLTDVKLPGISGIEFLAKIHEINRDIPVILMTAYAELDITVEAIKKGVFDFIIKPYQPEQIFHAVEKAVKYKRFIEMEKDYRRLLEEFNREVEALITERTMNLMAMTVADKVRNPAIIIGRIAKKLSEKNNISPDISENLKCIIQETEKLDSIVKDFHEMLKSKKSKFIYEDLNEIVRTAIQSVENKNIKLKTEISEQPLKINMEKNLIRIAIILLFKNAVEAIHNEGKISIKTYQDDEKAYFEITDSGEGISPEFIDKIFQPFFSTKKQGFGMGLPLVKQIVDEHLGEINVKSELNKGTTFILSFPLRWKE